eukprot:2919798-Prorocentrum_lima.AAC.1
MEDDNIQPLSDDEEAVLFENSSNLKFSCQKLPMKKSPSGKRIRLSLAALRDEEERDGGRDEEEDMMED